ncbi:S-antigen protein-like, partial [Penaeus monodon]|uniref:S-antigen protein-like n=1 Tax=Penaeus monodon TaxID=6687 RepID=UPI0018A715B2
MARDCQGRDPRVKFSRAKSRKGMSGPGAGSSVPGQECMARDSGSMCQGKESGVKWTAPGSAGVKCARARRPGVKVPGPECYGKAVRARMPGKCAGAKGCHGKDVGARSAGSSVRAECHGKDLPQECQGKGAGAKVMQGLQGRECRVKWPGPGCRGGLGGPGGRGKVCQGRSALARLPGAGVPGPRSQGMMSGPSQNPAKVRGGNSRLSGKNVTNAWIQPPRVSFPSG